MSMWNDILKANAERNKVYTHKLIPDFLDTPVSAERWD